MKIIKTFSESRIQQPASRVGFSLIEMLIYITILSVIMIIVVNTMILMTGTMRTLRVSKELNTGVINSLSKIENEIIKAQSVDETASVFDSVLGKLVLDSPLVGGGTEKVEIYLQGGVVKINRAGSYIGDLTGENTVVNGLVFKKSGSPTSLLKVEVSLTTSVGEKTKGETFYTSANLRNYK